MAQLLLPFEISRNANGRRFRGSHSDGCESPPDGHKKIYARAENLIVGEVFSKVGATEVIYPEIESAKRWAYKLIAPQIGEKQILQKAIAWLG